MFRPDIRQYLPHAGETSLVGSFEVFSDQRAKFIRFPEANVGSLVGYEYVQRHRPFVFEDNWRFQDRSPTRLARLSLQLPSGWEFTNYWANFPKREPQSSTNNLYVWEVEDIPGIEVEPDMPPFLAIESRMDIKYFPRDPNLRAKSTGHVERHRRLVFKSHQLQPLAVA
jgi:hypothetical protein